MRPRDLDPVTTGDLGGIGADQVVEPETRGHGDELEAPGPYDTWTELPSAEEDGPTYYDRPVIKEPVWIWSVPAYFAVGGAAGAAAVLGAAAQVRGGLDDLVGRCRWIAAAGTTVGTVLLVIDLGRPERFLNMLRVFRPTSPMSVGSWILAATSGLSSLAVAMRNRAGVAGTLGDTAAWVAGALGGPLAGYTAVLVTNTAVPAWQQARRSLPVVFVASGVTGAASLLDLMPLSARGAAVVWWYGLLGGLAELAAGEMVTCEAERGGDVDEPYHIGLAGTLFNVAKATTAASVVLHLLPGSGRTKRAVSGVLGTVGAVTLRFAVFHAGKRSSRDPRATFRQQRTGHGAAEVSTKTTPATSPRASSPLR